MACSGCPVFSNLLTVRENALLFTLLGSQCKAVASAVAQVYVSLPGCPVWRREDCGVVCLVKDRSQHSYFLRLYCVKRSKLLWEQELYVPFRYSAPYPYFHTFPANDCQAGLNFADEAEAERFCAAVERQIRQAPGPASKTLPNRSTGTSTSLALRKGPLPPLPSPLTRSVSSRDVSKSPLPPWVPQPPSMSAPPPPAGAHAERIRKTISFRPMGSPSAVQSDLVLSALRETFQKHQHLQHHKDNTTSQSEMDF